MYLVPGTWYQAQVSGHLVLVLALDLVPGTWYQTSGTKYENLPGSGSRYQVKYPNKRSDMTRSTEN